MSDLSDMPKDAEVDLNRQIRNAETHLKAIGAELVTLLGIDASISDAERQFGEALDAMTELRRELWDLRMNKRPE